MLLQLNVRYKTRVAVKFTGLPEGMTGLPKKPKRASVAAEGSAPVEAVAGE